jgi:ABC-type spermidine/putrescine transport system permease subunit II
MTNVVIASAARTAVGSFGGAAEIPTLFSLDHPVFGPDGTYFVGVPDVMTLPLLMFNASMGGNYQIASITALLLLVPSIGFMLVVERFLKADVLAMVGR